MQNKRHMVLVCQGTGCVSGGSEYIFSALKDELENSGFAEDILVKRTGCHGFCQQGPLLVIEPEGIFYTKVKTEDMTEIARSLQSGGKPLKRLLYHDPFTDKPVLHYHDIPFYGKQERTILRYCGSIDPEEIDDYTEVGGYKALQKAINEMTPEELISAIKRSGLRGLGGAGFPTGRKWESCRNAPGEKKYVICNADEGDPGAFQDRSVMEGNPHSVIEGMIIAAYAIGAQKGFLYVRAEYPLAVSRLKVAIEQARQAGFLGDKILESDFSFDLEIFQGAGAFVCGESTALVRSIEGKRGMPKVMPRPRTTEEGLWNKPTLLNNVKTFANIPLITLNGPEWFAKRGTEGSKGTAVFSLTGKVMNCGLIEVPMGATLRHIIYDIGGGVAGGKAFKAVQTGGPSGGCLPADMIDMPVDFDSLTQAGSIMGSGGLVVMDEETCMVDVARYFLDFNQRESCGQCIPCRLGTRQMYAVLDDITKGRGRPGDIDLLMELSGSIKRSSICGLGKTAPNPVLTTIRYFRDEYEAHITDKRCPAGICTMQ
ncbi:MAG: NAD(P)H-dependent oxidoreductase subunit E [Thermodesulfovibrionales bacterium]|nr:NAD(P)H-dependent oxidoreductase subunit E [Thermodesulfovibrionales bacterium]